MPSLIPVRLHIQDNGPAFPASHSRTEHIDRADAIRLNAHGHRPRR